MTRHPNFHRLMLLLTIVAFLAQLLAQGHA